MIAPISTTIVGKTTLPVTWRPLFKEGCFPFRSQPGTLSSLSFFFCFFLPYISGSASTLPVLFIVMGTLEKVGVGGKC